METIHTLPLGTVWDLSGAAVFHSYVWTAACISTGVDLSMRSFNWKMAGAVCGLIIILALGINSVSNAS